MPNTPLHIRVFGTKTSGQQLVVAAIHEVLRGAHIAYELEEVSQVDAFLSNNIKSVPAVQIEDEAPISLKLNGSFNASLRDTIELLLIRRDYGNMPKIVVPVDFSTNSIKALAYAHRLATQSNAIVEALHVYMPTAADIEASNHYQSEIIELRKEQLRKICDQFDVDWGSDLLTTAFIHQKLVIGFPGDEILEAMKSPRTMMTIMGTTGNNDKLQQWLGSVSTKVMHQSDKPVLLLPPQASYTTIKHVLFPFDDLTQDKAGLHQLIEFLGNEKPYLHLMHVGTKLKVPAYELVDNLPEDYPTDHIKFVEVISNSVAKSLVHFADSNRIDLIAMATHKKHWFQRIWGGSTTHEMALLTHKPLLILKPDPRT